MSDSVLDEFRRFLLRDPSAAEALGSIDDPRLFLGGALEFAASRGLALSPEDFAPALRPDPLGLFAPPGDALRATWPTTGWLPVVVSSSAVVGAVVGAVVEWAHFGSERLDQPFFEMSARRAKSRPLNRFCRQRMRLDDFVSASEAGPAPNGLIFHMSRCGSTLVAQMLAADRRNVVLSEAPPIDSMLRLNELRPGVSEEDRLRALLAIVSALGRPRAGEDRLFLKLDSWHILDLPLFQQAFPSTPWVFLYRDPVEVLVSQMRMRGIQTVPGLLPEALQGVAPDAEVSGEEFCARVLATSCAAAIDGLPRGGGLLVAYEELPDAFFSKILPHFGVRPEPAAQEAMRAAALRDAKSPHAPFTSDTAEKQAAATARIRDAARLRLDGLRAELDSLRAAAPPPSG